MRILAPLREPAIVLLWSGLLLSALGDQLFGVTVAWVSIRLLGTDAGYLTALQPLALVVSVLVIGRWVDRWSRSAAMIGADLARAAVLTWVAIEWITSGAPNIPALAATIVVLAIGQSVFQPALQATLPVLIRDPGRLLVANALLDATDRAARLLGPAVVAVAAGSVAAVHFLSLDAGSFLASAVAVFLMSRCQRMALTCDAGMSASHAGILSGARATFAHPVLGYVLLTVGIINGIWYATFFLALPMVIETHWHATSGTTPLAAYGFTISSYGCANLVSTIVCGSRALPRRPQVRVFAGNIIVGIGIVLIALAAGLPPDLRLLGWLAAAAFAAIGGPMKELPLLTLRQLCIPAGALRAAVRAYLAANNTGSLAAMAIAPSLFRGLGAGATVASGGLLIILVGLTGLIRYRGWQQVWPGNV